MGCCSTGATSWTSLGTRFSAADPYLPITAALIGQCDAVEGSARDVWNRAHWDGRGWTATYPGDRALADLLLAHGETFHGGVHHVIEALSAKALAAALDGYRFFGLDAAAAALEDARAR